MTSYTTKKLGMKAYDVDRSIEDLTERHRALVDYAERALSSTQEELEQLRLKTSVQGLNVIALRDALCNDMDAASQSWIPSILGTTGSGPWEEQEFDYFLQDRGIEPVEPPAAAINGLIVGATGWDEETISAQIYDRDAKSLRIYTQELFVMGLILRADPYDVLEQEAIDAVGYEHPAIQFILHRDFIWPWLHIENDSTTGGGSEIDPPIDWAKESVLRLMGYSVRAGGPDAETRREVLKQAFESTRLPGLEDEQHAARWGAARSSQRLRCIAEFLGWLISFQGIEKPEARQRWVADLQWLRNSFYGPTMKFDWPKPTGGQASPSPVNRATLLPKAAWPFPTASKY